MIRLPAPAGLRGQLLLAFSAVLILTVISVGIAVSVTSSQQVLDQMRQKALVGSHVLDSFLESRREQLESAVRVLTNDFGFRSAVATGDTPTISSALTNHGQRIGADLMVLVDPGGESMASSRRSNDPTAQRDFPFADALTEARRTGGAAAIAPFDGGLYQFFVVPVLAPEPIAWVVVAFAIDRTMARDLADLTDLDVTFAGLKASGQPSAVISTLPAAAVGALMADLRDYAGDADDVVYTNGDAYLSAVRRLGTAVNDRMFAVLQMPTRIISESTWLLIGQITAVLAVALALSMSVSLWLARRISDPVSRLIHAARSIERGRYDTPVDVAGSGEMALLGSALATMQRGIRDREAHIRHQADHDAVTGLPNLRYLERRHQHSPEPHTLCLLALRDLKDVSFSFGHELSEALLTAVGERLQAEPDAGTVARVSSNEFAVVLPSLAAEAALERARALRRRLGEPYPLGEHRLAARFDCAVIGFPRDAADFQTLFRGAETTLEAAAHADDGCMAYLPGHEEVRARQLAIIASFESACRDGQLSLHYQPKVELASGRVHECEALLRWQHPELGFVPPDEFITLAERSGNIRRLSDWVLDTAIAQVSTWRRRGLEMTVAVNLSAHDLADPELHGVIEDALGRHRASASWLVLEITESAVVHDTAGATRALLALKDLGFRISIDDFGTGQSSLAQLKKLPVDELKIDKSFVLELDTSADDALIVRSTIELGHNLGLGIVAEGVENEASLRQLMDYACDKAQGYHFARPLPAAEFEAWAGTANRQPQHLQEASGT